MSPDDFGSEMFRRETNDATAGSAAADDGVSTWLACSAASGACSDRCKRARPGPYTPVTDPASTPPSVGDGGIVNNASDTRTPALVYGQNAAGPRIAPPSMTPAAAAVSHGCYATAPASPIDLTGHDEAGSPSWHIVPPAVPPCHDHGPSPHDAAHVNAPSPLAGTVAKTQVLACLRFCYMTGCTASHLARLACYG